MIRVLIVDDSKTHRTALKNLIERAPGFSVAGVAEDGEQGVEQVHRLAPDIVLMDVNMPRLDGLGATERIMAEKPTPILLMTASENLRGEVALAYRAIEIGALELVPKPEAFAPDDPSAQALLTRLKLLAGVPVISHLKGRAKRSPLESRTQSSSIIRRARRVVVVAASTGGPRALKAFLNGLPPDLGAGIAIVQHIDGMFLEGLVRWLGEEGPLPVFVADHGRGLHENEVVLAPGGTHLELQADRRLALVEGPLDGGHRPSADRLLRSAALAYGSRATGVVLTGMGEDGARGLLAIREAGGTTIAQDEASSVVWGMPRAAVERGAAAQVLPLAQIPEAVAKAVKGSG